ncbi:MAG: hypothetical protein ACI9ME_001907, partial [Ilumatobacter sp.]
MSGKTDMLTSVPNVDAVLADQVLDGVV